MNTMKKNGGFTLVELIIVIAILAILSTAAIAGYSAYIQKANDAAVDAVLSDIYTSAVLANAETGAVKVTITESDDELEVKVEGVGSKFEGLFESSLKVGEKNSTNVSNGVYTGTIEKPSAWDNSKYAGVTVVLPEAEEEETSAPAA